MAGLILGKVEDSRFRGIPGDQNGMKSGCSEKTIADSNSFVRYIPRLEECPYQGACATQALLDLWDLIFCETNIFYKGKAFQRLNAELLFQSMFFFKELVKGVRRSKGGYGKKPGPKRQKNACKDLSIHT